MPTRFRALALDDQQDAWQDARRRILMLMCPLGVLACGLALWLQSPYFDTLDRFALPLLSVLLAGLFALLSWRAVAAEVAVRAVYGGFALYFLASLQHQFGSYVPHFGHLAEATYWFAALYCLAFLAWNTGAALGVAGATYLAALGIGLWNGAALGAEGKLGSQALAFLVQFYLAGGAVVAMLASFSRLKQRLAEVQLIAHVDFLTSLPNRRYGEEFLAGVTARGVPLAVALFDIDHFKHVNDTFGHHIGDHTLRDVAQVAGRFSRGATLVRWGGEEFLLILTGVSEHHAALIAERLRTALEAHTFPDVLRVTASFGLAERWPGESAQALLRRADAALYGAKRAGRNCVRTWTPELERELAALTPVRLDPALD